MTFQEVLNRLTGISCPIFGVSWNPPEAEVAIARRAITFLEDRRVRYTPSALEVPPHCVHSVIDVRRFLTDELSALNADQELAKSLRAMRAACRTFLDTVQSGDRDIVMDGNRLGHWESWVFKSALGELRGVFGVHIAMLAAEYGLDVEDDLASILPAADEQHGQREQRNATLGRHS